MLSAMSVLTRATWCNAPEDIYQAFSLQVNYTDYATATDQRILMPTFSDRGVSHGQCSGSPTAISVGFLDRSRYFFFHVAPHLSSRGSVDPIPDPLLFRNHYGIQEE
jgi:hypothetical protein